MELFVVGKVVVGEVVEAVGSPAFAVLGHAEEVYSGFFDAVVVLGAEVVGPALAFPVDDE